MAVQSASDLFRTWRKKKGLTVNEVALALTEVNCYADEKLIGNWFRKESGQRKPSPISPECQLALLQFFRQVCTAEEALEWVILTKLPLDYWSQVKALFPEADFEQALLKVMEQKLALKFDLHPTAQLMGYKPEVEWKPKGQGRMLTVERGMFLHGGDIVYTYQTAEATILCLQGEPKLLKIQGESIWTVNCTHCRSEWILTYLNQTFVERMIGESLKLFVAHYLANQYADDVLLLLAVQAHYQGDAQYAEAARQLLLMEYPQSPHGEVVHALLGHPRLTLADYVSRLTHHLITQIAPHLLPHLAPIETVFWPRLTPQLAVREARTQFLTSGASDQIETLTILLATYLTTQKLLRSDIPVNYAYLMEQAMHTASELELTAAQTQQFVTYYVELVRCDWASLVLIKKSS